MQDQMSKAASLLSYWDKGYFSRALIARQWIAGNAKTAAVTLGETFSEVPSNAFSDADNVWLLLTHGEALQVWIPVCWDASLGAWSFLGAPAVATETLDELTRSTLEQFFITESPLERLEWKCIYTYLNALLSAVGVSINECSAQLIKSEDQSSYESEIKRILTDSTAITPLMARFVDKDCPESIPERSAEEVSHDSAAFAFLSGWTGNVLGFEARRILWHLMTLPQGQIQAIETPLGSNVDQVLSAFASSALLDNFLRGQSPYKLGLVVDESRVSNLPTLNTQRWLDGAPAVWSTLDRVNRWLDEAPLMALERRFVENAQAQYPKARSLSQVISELTSSLTLQRATVEEATAQAQEVKAVRYRFDRQYQSKGGLDAQWKELQDKDAALEKAYSDLAQASVEWTVLCRSSWFARIGRSLPFGQRQWREKVWNFYESNLKGLIPWQEDAFNQGAVLSEVLHARLRSIRTERSKLHQQMVPLSEAIAQRSGAEKKWLQWQKTALPDFNFGTFADIESAQDPSRIANEVERQLSQQLANTVLHLGEALCLQKRKEEKGLADRLEAIFLLCPIIQGTAEQFAKLIPLPKKFSAKTAVGREVFDCIVIQSEVAQHPAEALPLLYRAQRAVFLGDRLHGTTSLSLLEGQDTSLAISSSVVVDDMEYDEQRAKGIMLSHASSFLLARSNSAYKKPQTYGLSAQSELMLTECAVSDGIVGFLNTQVYKEQLKAMPLNHPAVFPALSAAHVVGQVEETEEGPVNHREALSIGLWLKKHIADIKSLERGHQMNKPVCVVTISIAQKRALQHQGVSSIPVFTIDELPKSAYQWVILSPVLTRCSRRPLLFDTEQLLLSKLVSLAVQSFMVFGDLSNFDKNANTPCGALGRSLFPTKSALLLQSDLPPLTNEAEVLKLTDMQKLKSQLDQFVQKAQSRITIASTALSIRTIEHLRLTGDINKAIGRKVKVDIIVSKDDLMLLEDNKILNTWKKAGVNIKAKQQIFDNVVVVDQNEVYEFTFPLLSVKNDEFPVQLITYLNQDAKTAIAALALQDATHSIEREPTVLE